MGKTLCNQGSEIGWQAENKVGNQKNPTVGLVDYQGLGTDFQIATSNLIIANRSGNSSRCPGKIADTNEVE